MPRKNIHLLDNIAIVLVNPKYSENIGSAARAAWNMGIKRIIVVADEYPHHEKMMRLATRNAAHLIDTMEFHEDLGVALQPFSQVSGTTARRGRNRITGHSPREIMNIITPLLANNQVAFLFGAEDRGLTNNDLQYCQLRSAIPTADFSSLNLAQAVAIHSYEIFHAVVHDKKTSNSQARLAPSHETENMYQYVEDSLKQLDFLRKNNRTYYMRNIRQFLGRIQLKSQETTLIRNICRQFLSGPQSTKK